MSQPRTRGGVPAFAGLRSFMSGGRRADDAPEKDKDEDEEARKARRAEEDEKREQEDARRAEEDQRREEEDARRAEEDSQGDDEDKDKKDGKKAKNRGRRADEPDDEECEEEDDPDAKVASAARAGRLAERARWVNALNDPSTSPHAAAACVMLASTDMHSSAVIAAVQAFPAPPAAITGRSRIDERMERVRTPAIPADGGQPTDPNSPEGKAAAIILAGKKRRGEA